jgi:hypothetical protein
MSQTHASPEALDRMAKNITKFLQVQQDVVSALKRDYQAVGGEWQDKKYQELGAVVDQAVTAINSSSAPLSTCVTKVQVLKGILEQYLSTTIG